MSRFVADPRVQQTSLLQVNACTASTPHHAISFVVSFVLIILPEISTAAMVRHFRLPAIQVTQHYFLTQMLRVYSYLIFAPSMLREVELRNAEYSADCGMEIGLEL